MNYFEMNARDIEKAIDRFPQPVDADQYLVHWNEVVQNLGYGFEKSPRGFEAALSMIVKRMVVAERTLGGIAEQVGGTYATLVSAGERRIGKHFTDQSVER